MTKDFKRQSTAADAFGQYGLGWMVGGVAIGLLIGAGMYALANKGNAPDASTTTASISSDPAVDSAMTGTNAAASLQDTPAVSNEPLEETPGFSYHAVLPQLEVDVPMAVQTEPAPVSKAVEKSPEKAPEKAPAKVEKPADKKKEVAAVPVEKETGKKEADKKAAAPAASVVPTGFNGFQIGSYKTPDQAADMQSRLKKKGLSSRVEQANIQGATWYRVKVGPAASPDILQKWQQTLSGMGISPLAVRM